MNHWKTTANGFLSAFIGAVGPISGFLASLQMIQAQIPGHAPANYTLAIVGAGLTCGAAIARIWIGLLQNDAPPADSITVTTVQQVSKNPPAQVDAADTTKP